jgi:membrane protease YdiL (CAAX protease family)
MYEVLVVFANQDALTQVRVGAEVWLKQLFALIGSAGLATFGAAVLIVGFAIFWYERKQHIPLRPRFFMWMILESAVYAVFVAIMVSGLVGAILTIAVTGAGAGAFQNVASMDLSLKLALSIGAGIYEELLFRVILVGGLYLLVRRIAPGRGIAYAIAAIVGALIFSWVHYLGPYGDVFTIGSFLFRFFFGLVLNFIFLLRGFGIAAWTHALYDVMLVVGFLG